MGNNRLLFPPREGPLNASWTTPLEMVQSALQGGDRLPSDDFFDLGDFMIMARVVRATRPDIQLYKHIYTRSYINVDPSGHTYRYHPPRDIDSDRPGSYRPHRSFRGAVKDLGLRELPWMKPGLEQHRRGIPWQDRWLLFDYANGDLLPDDAPLLGAPPFSDSESWYDSAPEL